MDSARDRAWPAMATNWHFLFNLHATSHLHRNICASCRRRSHSISRFARTCTQGPSRSAPNQVLWAIVVHTWFTSETTSVFRSPKLESSSSDIFRVFCSWTLWPWEVQRAQFPPPYHCKALLLWFVLLHQGNQIPTYQSIETQACFFSSSCSPLQRQHLWSRITNCCRSWLHVSCM